MGTIDYMRALRAEALCDADYLDISKLKGIVFPSDEGACGAVVTVAWEDFKFCVSYKNIPQTGFDQAIKDAWDFNLQRVAKHGPATRLVAKNLLQRKEMLSKFLVKLSPAELKAFGDAPEQLERTSCVLVRAKRGQETKYFKRAADEEQGGMAMLVRYDQFFNVIVSLCQGLSTISGFAVLKLIWFAQLLISIAAATTIENSVFPALP